jgi:hypothetical protein
MMQINLPSLEVTKNDPDVASQLIGIMRDTINDDDDHFHQFIQELLTIVPSTASMNPYVV